MSSDAWFTLAIVVVTIAMLASERVSPPLTIVGAVTVLLVTGVIDTEGALSGFSNEAVITIVALYVLAGAAEATGALDHLTGIALGRSPARPGQDRATRRELLRLLTPAGFTSAFIYNTPLVGMLAPQVSTWARRSRRSASWYLMALNYAVLLGGVVTAIGTTTNIVVSGLLQDAHRSRLDLFEITPVGLPVAAAGIALVVFLAPRLVPNRRGSSEDLGDVARTFTVEMMVPPGSVLIGRTVADAGLRNLDGVYLVEIDSNGRTIAPVAPEEILAADARLTFAGNVDRVLDLQRIPGLASAEERHFSVTGDGPDRQFYEAVVAAGSVLVGSTLKETGFRRRYRAAVVAIHRAGERVPGKLGDVRLHAGDVLLVLGRSSFVEGWRDSGEFLVIAPLGDARPLRRDKAWIVEIVLAAFLVVAATGLLSVLEAALLASLAIVATRVLSPTEARNSVNFDVVIVLASSFGLGAAISQSGLASELARLLIDAFGGLGDVGVLAGVLAATVVVTQLVTNNATAVVMFPIALATAAQAGLAARPLVIAVALGASMSFLTPIGYQTNLMVYGMGGYKFHDFLFVGIPLTIVTFAVTLVMVPIAFPLH